MHDAVGPSSGVIPTIDEESRIYDSKSRHLSRYAYLDSCIFEG